MSDYGIIISKELYRVQDASLENLSFTSETNSFKIKLEGNYSITIPAGQLSASITIYHNLGYEPAVLVFGDAFPNDASKRNRLPLTDFSKSRRHYCEIYTDRIVISAYHSEGPYQPFPNYDRIFTGHYYIFTDPLFT